MGLFAEVMIKNRVYFFRHSVCAQG